MSLSLCDNGFHCAFLDRMLDTKKNEKKPNWMSSVKNFVLQKTPSRKGKDNVQNRRKYL